MSNIVKLDLRKRQIECETAIYHDAVSILLQTYDDWSSRGVDPSVLGRVRATIDFNIAMLRAAKAEIAVIDEGQR